MQYLSAQMQIFLLTAENLETEYRTENYRRRHGDFGKPISTYTPSYDKMIPFYY